MPPPEIGRPLPRAADAYTARTKWDRWILHDDHHGPDWRSSFGEVTFEEAWSALAHAILTAGVVNVRSTARFGLTCAVDVVITLNGRSRTVRSAWHYQCYEAAPRLITAYPRT